MKKSRICAIVMFACMIINLCGSTYATENNVAQLVVAEYFECISEKRWSDLQMLLCDENQAEYLAFISNPDNEVEHKGYFNYTSAELISCEEVLDDTFDLSYVDSQKIDQYTDWKLWDCIVDVIAYNNTMYLNTGHNRYIVYTACDSSGNYRILEVLRIPDYQQMLDSASTFSYDAPVSAGTRTKWENPETINVRNYGTVDFREYCYIVTANEFGTNSYNQEARKAVALCVKQYGWNRTLVQKYHGLGYDVQESTGDQVYNPSKIPSALVVAAVDYIWDFVMLTCDYKLFCSFHTANQSVNSYARYHGGILSQQEANSLGNEGYSWMELLHYYYDYGEYNSEMTQGEISVVCINHIANGLRVKIQGNLSFHYIKCMICGCLHEEEHVWELNNGMYTCMLCNLSSNIAPLLSASAEEE